MIHHLFVGIDVSKDTLDVAATLDGDRFETRRFLNDSKGFRELHGWLLGLSNSDQWRIGLEATSAYHHLLVRWFEEKGELLLVLNPKQARDLAKGLGILRKNDATDARVLALCMMMAWRQPEHLPDATGQRLQEISRRIDVLVRLRADEKRRLQKPGAGAEICASMKRHIVFLDKEILRLEKEWLESLNASQELLRSYVLALGVPGIGPKIARVVVSELCVRPRKRTGRECVAYAGLAPHERTSGTSLRKQSKALATGNKRIRTALYMGAVSVIRKDPGCRDLYMRLIGKGKHKKLALVAVMSKLMRRLSAVLNRGTPWQQA